MDLMVCLASSPYASFRRNICSIFFQYWDIRYAEALVLFLNDSDRIVSDTAKILLKRILDKDLYRVLEIITFDKYSYGKHKELLDNLSMKE